MNGMSAEEILQTLEAHDELTDWLEQQARKLDEYNRYLSYKYVSGNYITFEYMYNDSSTAVFDFTIEDLMNASTETAARLKAEREAATRAARERRQREAEEQREREERETLARLAQKYPDALKEN